MKKILLLLVLVMSTLTPCISMAEPPPGAVRLSTVEQKQLNRLFTNFSEAFVEPFRQNELTDKILIRFGLAHNYQNRDHLFEKLPGGEKMRIKASHVSESAQKYFGRHIVQHRSVDEVQYKDGYYVLVQASGELQQFSQVEHMLDLGNNRYAVDVNVYSASSGWVGSMHGTPQSWKKSGDEIPELSHKMKATIAKTTGVDGKSSYILLDYLKH